MQEPCLLVGIWAGVRGQSQVVWEASWGEKNMFGLVLMKGGGELGCGAVRHFKPEAWDLWGMVGPCCPSVLGLLHPPQIVAGSLPSSLSFLGQSCCLHALCSASSRAAVCARGTFYLVSAGLCLFISCSLPRDQCLVLPKTFIKCS